MPSNAAAWRLFQRTQRAGTRRWQGEKHTHVAAIAIVDNTRCVLSRDIRVDVNIACIAGEQAPRRFS
ncbi:hypothetical protein [Xanthomonas euvesicatoria]|uniref:hypothetical protein n=1 Tax=Xanthomonas euvesicatoria TaxID=456327 RepID=UPI0026E383B5|nr:hypothetical protein [Xanthomonas euvesicatoria]MDO7930517.1 hypothetical protein [Xanthomonas euvesicatoria pv. eucalypti]